ncbi:MAG TPA: alpha/beta family hydrolase, partial [Streptosporangiaceae bacterium]
MTSLEVATRCGPALVDWTAPGPGAVPFVMALTHGAGGTVNAPDLLAARDAATRLGGGVALVTQPYRVRGGRAPGSAGRQDEAWIEIMSWLRSAGPAAAPGPARSATWPLIVGGRSNGARVASRTAETVGAHGVLALAFPLQPPARRARGRQ